MTTPRLSAEVGKLYDLVDWVGGSKQNFGKFGTVDIPKLTLQRAKALVQIGFPKLKLKEVVVPTDTNENPPDGNASSKKGKEKK